MQALDDNPVENPADDRYGFQPYAKILAEMIRDTENLPFCIGIYGQWGTGKSSLMKLIEHKVRDTDVRTIWFNPWKYHKREELWSALIRGVLVSIQKDGNDEAKQLATTLLKTTAWTLIKRAAGTLTIGMIAGEDLENLKEKLAASEKEYQQHINSFEDDFATLVSKYTNKGKLILFIDDLDRCLPESAITVLESLKLFIGHAQCAFVLGMDKVIVELGIQKIYGDQIRLTGRDYLDKIIQVPFYIPAVPFNKLRDSIQVTKTANYVPQIWLVLEHGMGGNPRKTKRFVNSFYLLRQILSTDAIEQYGYQASPAGAPALPHDDQDIYLAKLLTLQLTHPAFYEYLAANPSAWQLIEDKILEGTADQRKAIFVDYPELKTFLDDAGLRRFMEKTTAKAGQMPQAPSAEVVSLLLRAVSLVSDRSPNSPESQAK